MESVKTLRAIDTLLNEVPNLVEVANRCDCDYAKRAGIQFVPFGADEPEKVAQNLAGLHAVVTGIGIIALLRLAGKASPHEIDDLAILILSEIATNQISDLEVSILQRLANCTWCTCQPFRTDKGPLGRATRTNTFDLLRLEDEKKPENEREIFKDLRQVCMSTIWLLEKLKGM